MKRRSRAAFLVVATILIATPLVAAACGGNGGKAGHASAAASTASAEQTQAVNLTTTSNYVTGRPQFANDLPRTSAVTLTSTTCTDLSGGGGPCTLTFASSGGGSIALVSTTCGDKL